MTRRSGIPRQRRRHHPARGFTLVELMVAIMVMTVGVLGLASTAGVVTRLMSGGARQAIAANVVQTRFELLRNRRCTWLAAHTPGDTTTRGIHEKWVVRFPGLNIAKISDTVTFSVMSGHAASPARGYESYIPCR